MKVVLCAYESAGEEVLRHVASRGDTSDVAVFTHDAPSWIPSVLQTAQELGIWATTERIDVANLPFRPDVISSVYYRNIIRSNVIAACDGRIFNAHPSLLPRHRGCSSIPWALIEGDATVGVTFHYVDAGIDTGPILLQSWFPVNDSDTQFELYRRAMAVVVALWPTALSLVRGGAAGTPQTGESCYHSRGAPYNGEIDDTWSLDLIGRFIRAMTLPPRPYATYRGYEVRTLDDYLALRGTGGRRSDAIPDDP